jgi:hypothetical protein
MSNTRRNHQGDAGVSEALARVEAQREKLAGQFVELEATERARNLAEYGKGRKPGVQTGPTHRCERSTTACHGWQQKLNYRPLSYPEVEP